MESFDVERVAYELECLGFEDPEVLMRSVQDDPTLRVAAPCNYLPDDVTDYRCTRMTRGVAYDDGRDCRVIGSCDWNGPARVCVNEPVSPPYWTAWVQDLHGNGKVLFNNTQYKVAVRLRAADVDAVTDPDGEILRLRATVNDRDEQIKLLTSESEQFKRELVRADYDRDTAVNERDIARLEVDQLRRDLALCRAQLPAPQPAAVHEWPRHAGTSGNTVTPRLLVYSGDGLRGDYRVTLDDVSGPRPIHSRQAFKVRINVNSGQWVHIAWLQSDSTTADLINGHSRVFPRRHRLTPQELLEMIEDVTGANFTLVDVKSAFERSWNVL